jgi:hypothetical protein
MLPMADDVNFRGGWDAIIKALESATGSEALFEILSVAGVAVVVAAFVVSLIFNRRRGGNPFAGHGSTVVGAVVAAGLLAAPKVVIPALLWVVDVIGNAVIQAFRNSGISI